MAQAIQIAETVSTASGAEDVFPTVWTFEFAEEVRVLVRIGAVTTLQVEGVDYDLSDGGWLTNGADVVFRNGKRPVADAVVTRQRATLRRQLEPFGDQERFRPQASEAAYDRNVRMSQDQATRAARGLSVPPGETGIELPPHGTRNGGLALFLAGAIVAFQGGPGSVLGFDPTTGLPVSVTPNFVVDSSPATVATRFAAAASSFPNTLSFIRTMGYLTVGDGGGADYSRSLVEPAHGAKFQSVDGAWWEIIGSEINVRALGAVGDGFTDDTAAFQAANSVGRNILIPGVDDHYRVTTQVVLVADGQHVRGEGRRSRVIQEGGDANAIVFYGNGLDNVGVHDCWLTPGTETSAQLLGYAVHFRNCSRVSVDGVVVSGHRRGAVLLEGSRTVLVSKCRAQDAVVDADIDDHTTAGFDFFIANGGEDIEISQCTAERGAGVGFAVQSQQLPGGADPFEFKNIRILGNVAREQGMYGFVAYRRQASDIWSTIVFADNLAEDITGAIPHEEGDRRFGSGYSFQGIEGVNVQNNRAIRCAVESANLILGPAGFSWQNMRVLGEVSGNVSEDSGQYGYFVGDPNSEGTGSPLTRLGSNISRRSRLDGIQFLSIPYPVIEGGESVDSTDGSGLRVADNVGHLNTARSNINGLKCRGNATNGLSIAAGGSVIDNVLAETSGTDGIALTAAGRTHVVRNSRMVSNGARGLLAPAGIGRIETRGNQFEDNAYHIAADSPIVGLRSNTYVDAAGAPNAGNAKLIDTYCWIRTLADGATPTIYAEEWAKSGGTTAVTTVNGLAEGETATFISAHTVTLLGVNLIAGKVAQLTKLDGTVRVVSVSS